SSVTIEHGDGVATILLSNGKVNALDADTIAELRSTFRNLANKSDTAAVVLTASGPFFSFGFDVPSLYPLSPEAFTDFPRGFTALSLELFACPKPLVAALNGHVVAGGCMLALAADLRLMADGAGRVGLNEAAFGSSLFAGSVEMLRFAVGSAAA